MAIITKIDSVMALSSRFALLTAVSGFVFLLYVLVLGIYRLYLSPLAKFPGPKLAALTQWVETYYELFKGDGGQFAFEYAKWHEKYGRFLAVLNLLSNKRFIFSGKRPNHSHQPVRAPYSR